MESVETKALNYDVWTIPVVKPLNATQLCQLAENRRQIIIVEENQKSAGIGSAIIEVLSDAYNNGLLKTYPKIRRIAINDEFLEVAGSQRYLQQTAGLIL
jgi:transketolase